MTRHLVFYSWFCVIVCSVEYYGAFVGKIATSELQAEVYLVNSTHLQINNFRTTIADLSSISFVIIEQNGKREGVKLYEYLQSQGGEWLRIIGTMGNENKKSTRLVVKMSGSDVQKKQFAVVNNDGKVLASIQLDKTPPQPFCCFEKEADMGLFGEYGIISDSIEVLDSRTLRIPSFSYKASQTPDGYFYAGAGPEINASSGKKAQIIGRDDPNRICAMRTDIVDQDIIIRLEEGQTIYDIEWLSVFCYQYSHDFGHIDLGLVEDEELVPPFIPEIRQTPPSVSHPRPC